MLSLQSGGEQTQKHMSQIVTSNLKAPKWRWRIMQGTGKRPCIDRDTWGTWEVKYKGRYKGRSVSRRGVAGKQSLVLSESSQGPAWVRSEKHSDSMSRA